MRVLLDESLPRRLASHLRGVEAETVASRGWAGLKNGELLNRAVGDFDVFVTADQNLQYQQNLAGYDIAVIVLAAPSNRLDDLLPLVDGVLNACGRVPPGEVVVVRLSDDGGAA